MAAAGLLLLCCRSAVAAVTSLETTASCAWGADVAGRSMLVIVR